MITVTAAPARPGSRLDWVDGAKAIGMFWVVMGHHRHPLYDYIYSFHMPLFFFISGLLFNAARQQPMATVIRRRAASLLIPYFFFAFFLYGFWLLLGQIQPDSLRGASLLKNFIGIFYSQGQLEYMAWGVELWFLPCLFLVSVLYAWLCRFSLPVRSLMLLVLALVSHIYARESHVRLPWSLDLVAPMCVFYMLGSVSRSWWLEQKPRLVILPVMLAGLALNLLFFWLNQERIDVYQGIFLNEGYFYASALGGIVFWLLLSQCLRFPGFLLFLGSASLVFYTLHMRAFTVINFVSEKALHLHYTEGDLIPAVLMSLLQLALVFPVAWFMNRYLGVLTGKGLKRPE